MFRYFIVLNIFFIYYVFSEVFNERETLDLPEGSPCIQEFPYNFTMNGTCANFYRCPGVIPDILNRRQYRLGKYHSICSFDGLVPIICCTSCNLVQNISDAVIAKSGHLYWKSGSKSWDKCLEYSSNLPYSCDSNSFVANYYEESADCYNLTQRRPLVSGGLNADRGDFPHMALLGYGDDLRDAQWLCGGTIISEDFVLTAAHCIGFLPLGEVKHVAVGILKRSDPDEYWQTRTVVSVIAHPQYHSPSKYHDIALLKVDTPFRFSKQVLPACLQSPFLDEERIKSDILATGWGATGFKQNLSDTLQVVALQERSTQFCSRQYGKHRNLRQGFDAPSQMCLGDIQEDHHGDTCQGDSGSPLQFHSDSLCNHVVIGVTSYGRPCGVPGGAGIYTRVERYVGWIESVVWG